ncbi:hypothetical protein ACFQY8_02615 [Alloscardovia venturai]|uniref:Uncharacterized protein n=1 Tax=Alloscardovia venturai TaxID=1769421 RepID=A0ABW2Y4I4_9BIFI
MRKIQVNALIEYLSPLSKQYREQIEHIEHTLGERDDAEIQQSLDSLTTQLEDTSRSIELLISQGSHLATELQDVREQIAETDTLSARYQELASSYQARIERYNFVENGYENVVQFPEAMLCPICNQPVPPQLQEQIFSPHRAEKENLEIRLADLLQTIEEMKEERNSLKAQETQPESQCEDINKAIDIDLKPQLAALQRDVENYRSLLSLTVEKEHMNNLLNETNKKIANLKNREFPNMQLNIFDYFPSEFSQDFGEKILDILGACAFPHLAQATFDETTFDAIINNQPKNREGKGYRSLINTAMFLALREYLASCETAHAPSILMIDTPLLGLDDPQVRKDSKEFIDTIPNALYEYLMMNQEYGQVIIADNQKFMPDIDMLRGKCNLIHFSKQNDSEDRYGFLHP